MSMKKLIPMVFVTSLLFAGCGPKALSDMEFADAAQDVCSTLHTESASLSDLDLTARAAAYQHAVDALVALNITEESAPQGTKLRSGLTRLADSFGEFGKAISDATLKANLQEPVAIAITEDGSVFGYPESSVFDITKLDVDPTILSDLRTYQAQVQEAATSLKLEDCVIKW